MNKIRMNNYPPNLPLRFFRWFCHPKLRDSIEGDLMELYEERKVKNGKLKADAHFIKDVLLLSRCVPRFRIHAPSPLPGLTLGYFTLKTTRVNPAQTLKNE